MSVFTALDNHSYLNLKTFRSNGDGVPTPVWFYQDGDDLYIMTNIASGKVKRINADSTVEVAPCKFDGELLGDFVPASATVLSEEAQKLQAFNLLKSKYGQEDFWTKLSPEPLNPERAYIKVTSRT